MHKVDVEGRAFGGIFVEVEHVTFGVVAGQIASNIDAGFVTGTYEGNEHDRAT